MPTAQLQMPQGYSFFYLTMRCNSRQFLIAKIPHKLRRVCCMANQLHLLIRPKDAKQLPRLMHWISWLKVHQMGGMAFAAPLWSSFALVKACAKS